MLLAEPLIDRVTGLAIEVHRHAGPGLLKSVYEQCLCRELLEAGIALSRQVSIPIIYKDTCVVDGFKADIVVAPRTHPGDQSRHDHPADPRSATSHVLKDGRHPCWPAAALQHVTPGGRPSAHCRVARSQAAFFLRAHRALRTSSVLKKPSRGPFRSMVRSCQAGRNPFAITVAPHIVSMRPLPSSR